MGSNLNKTISRMSVGGIKRDGGIKLLDITEQPMGRDSKRRKKVANEENTETKQKENEKLETESATPDYAAGLTSIVPPSPAPPSYAPPATPAPQPTVISSTESFPQIPTPAQQPTAPQVQQRFQVNIDSSPQTKPENNQVKPDNTVLTTTPTPPTTITSTPLQIPPQIVQQVQTIRPQQVQQTPQQPQQQPFIKRQLQLSREQMFEAQEMFNNSNKVTRPEKALILGFMAGSRENPCPHLGNVVTIKLSENEEDVRQQDGTVQKMIVETHFQMNYNNGEWKRVQKYRKLDQQQLQTMTIQGYPTLQQTV